MEDFLKSRHIPVVAILFDGLFICGDSVNASEHDWANPAQNDLANEHIDELPSDMEQYVQEKTNYSISLDFKRLLPPECDQFLRAALEQEESQDESMEPCGNCILDSLQFISKDGIGPREIILDEKN